MNRFKKEAKRKRDETRKGLSPKEIVILDKKEEEDNKISELARKIHIKRFPEEYDFMYDDHVDSNQRDIGINPMSKEYVDRIKEKREALGVSPLSESGMSISDDTMALCFEEAKKMISELKVF
jgi:hypothetical protein